MCIRDRPSIDYQIGSTWDGLQWEKGPDRFIMTEKETLRFAMSSNTQINTTRILRKVIKIIESFIPSLNIKYNIFDDCYDLYFAPEIRD